MISEDEIGFMFKVLLSSSDRYIREIYKNYINGIVLNDSAVDYIKHKYTRIVNYDNESF